MKIFISWSGKKSKAVAEKLRDWLPLVINRIEPWVSSLDIDKGQPWFKEVQRHLKDSRITIFCLTSENKNKPWIYYEAGTLSQNDKEKVLCPYLIDLDPSDVNSPLSQYQLTIASKDDTLKLLQTINKEHEKGERVISKETLKKAFNQWWPELEMKLNEIREMESVYSVSSEDIFLLLLSMHSSFEYIIEELRGIITGNMNNYINMELRNPIDILKKIKSTNDELKSKFEESKKRSISNHGYL